MASYITLASDSSPDIFPGNAIGSFRVKLPRKIYLDRKRHQVGMKYISYPLKSHNVDNGKMSIIFFSETNLGEQPIQFDTEIEAGYYKGPYEVATALNRALALIPDQFVEKYRPIAENRIRLDDGTVNFEYNPRTELITVHAPAVPDYTISMVLSKELYVKLGIGLEEEIRYESGDWTVVSTLICPRGQL